MRPLGFRLMITNNHNRINDGNESGSLHRMQTAIAFCIVSLSITSSSRVTAGIILDSNGYVTSATLNDGTQDFDFTFVQSTWDNLTTLQQDAITGAPWWDSSATAAQNPTTPLNNITSNLVNEITAAYNNPTQPRAYFYIVFGFQDWDPFYAYAALGVVSVYNVDPLGQQYIYSNRNVVPKSIINSTGESPYRFAIPDSTSVPEPSTAIAMGLLGIVGFAGNRRRRRQELVA